LIIPQGYAAPQAAVAALPRPDHVVIVVEENHSYSQVIGSSAAPYINALARSGASFTDAHGVVHPSQPNYLALFSGSTQGVTDDSCPHTFGTANLGRSLLNAGLTFAGYSEDLPAVGSTVCSSGSYRRKHSPWVNFSNLPTSTNLPFTSFPSDYRQLPQLSFVIPNQAHDMHDGTIQQADTWLQQHLDGYVQWARTHNSLLIVTWDEDDFTATNHIPTLFVGPMVRAGAYSETINHYRLLRTLEDMYGLPAIGASGGAAPITSVWAGAGGPTATAVPPTGAVPPAATQTRTATRTPTRTPTRTATRTPTRTATPAARTPTAVPSRTNTPVPPANTPPPVATATATPGGAPDSLALPIRAAFVYPWFPEAWTQHGIYPYTRYTPSLGYYNQNDPAILTRQIAAMQYGNIQAGIASWWGQGTPTDGRIPALLAAAHNTSFRWALYYEAEGSGNPSVAQIQADLNYIHTRYMRDPNYLWVNGRPVIFVYGDGGDSCAMATRWAQANTIGAYVVLKVFSGYRTCGDQPAGWHQYGPAVATDSQAGYSFAISPGFYKADEAAPRLVRDLNRWQQNIRSMITSQAPWQLITTFNEWGEGTSVESSTGWASASGWGAYLDALHSNGGLAPVTTNNPPGAAAQPQAPRDKEKRHR
jgi:hypothetical protein